MSVEKAEGDLKYFIGCALTGLCANTAYNSPNTQKFMQAKGLTIEKLAILSGVNIMEELEKFRAELNNPQIEKKGLILADSPL